MLETFITNGLGYWFIHDPMPDREQIGYLTATAARNCPDNFAVGKN